MIKIREASICDSKDLAIIHSSSWKIAYKNIIPDEILDNITVEKRTKAFENIFNNNLKGHTMIFKDDKPAGFICIFKSRDEDLDEDVGEIGSIYLHPNYFNMGIGTILLEWGINELKSQGYKKISLWVLKDNINAIKFYEKHGFVFDNAEKEINIRKILIECRYIKNVD